MEGVPASEIRDELNANATRREELKAKLAAADEPPPLLHPGTADLYRQKVTALAEALEHPETRTEASEALRGLIDGIVLTPNQGEPPSRAGGDSCFGEPRLQIELKGSLAGCWEPPQMRRGRRKLATSRCKLEWCGGCELVMGNARRCGCRLTSAVLRIERLIRRSSCASPDGVAAPGSAREDDLKTVEAPEVLDPIAADVHESYSRPVGLRDVAGLNE